MENEIMSEYYRNYLNENGIELTDRQRALMLWFDKQILLDNKLNELEKLLDKTDDELLKDEISKAVKKRREDLEFMKQQTENSVYKLDISARADDLFNSFEDACEFCEHLSTYIKNRGENYCIYKIGIRPGNYYSEHLGQVLFNTDREILGAVNFMKNWGYDSSMTLPPPDFLFEPFPNPFERGDIVRDYRNRNIGVVETSQENWKKILSLGEIFKKQWYYVKGLYKPSDEERKRLIELYPGEMVSSLFESGSVGVCVNFLGDGDIKPDSIQPVYLEKLPLNKKGIPESFDTENNSAEYLLCKISDLLRGERYLGMGIFGSELYHFSKTFMEWAAEKEYSRNIKRRNRNV